MYSALLASGLTAAGVGSFFACLSVLVKSKTNSRRRKAQESLGAGDAFPGGSIALESSEIQRKIISLLAVKSQVSGAVDDRGFGRVWSFGLGSSGDLLKKAGLAGRVSVAGIINVRKRFALGLGLLGFLFGFLFSELLAVLLLCIGFLLGWRMPVQALRREKQARSDSVERDLARMLEVVVLGLRGGLSFDQSIMYYTKYFSGGLAASISLAQTQWSFGLLGREEALRALADSYDSRLVREAVDSISRSLRYGTSLADDLSDLAVSVRARRKARLEEAVAKAPVKMLLPVGTLILPAMLILVVGPILLDLMNRF